jgi:hypothetical protein
MLEIIIKWLAVGIGVFFGGKLLWRLFLKYQANRFNKAALIAVDNQIKKLIKKLDPADVKATEQLAKIKQKEKNLKELVNLYEKKLENDN